MNTIIVYLIITVSSPDAAYVREMAMSSMESCKKASVEYEEKHRKNKSGFGFPNHTATCVKY